MQGIQERTTLGFAVTLLSVLITGFISYHSANGVRASMQSINSTLLVTTKLQDLRLAAREIEVAKDGYLLTGDRHNEQVFTTAVDTARSNLQSLANLTAADTDDTFLVRQMQSTLEKQVDQASQLMALRRRAGLAAVLPALAAHSGAADAEFLDATAQELSGGGSEVLSTEHKSANSQLVSTIFLIALGTFCAFLFLTLSAFVVRGDIAHRIRTEDALRESNQRLGALIAASPLAIVTLDAHGKIRSWNEAAQRTFGWSSDEVLGADPPYLIPDTEKKYRALVERVLNGESFTEVETMTGRKDGMIINISLSLAPLYADEATVGGAMAIMADITQRKQAEEELREAKEAAEVANTAKSEFLANMSHELRTPLNAIIGFSELLEARTFGELNDKQLRYVNNVLTSGRHLLQLINDILDLAKVEAGRMELDMEAFDVASALHNVESIVRAIASKKNIDLQVMVADGLPQIIADAPKFKQIMYNLLSNSIKFTPDGGKILVLASEDNPPKARSENPLSYHSPDQRHRLRISVTDTGIGIRPEDQERIFGEFEQVDSSYARKQQGTGLGLALTRKLVDLHGGRIWVESEGEVGNGSTFAFVLPLQPATNSMGTGDQAGSEIAMLQTPASKPLVLVAEDDRAAASLLKQYLIDAGYAVTQAFNGEEVVQMAKDLHPFAITLDVILPKKDGWSVLAELKTAPETRDIPVIIVSITNDQKLGVALGAEEFLIKPINRERLLEVLERPWPNGTGAKTVLVVDDEASSRELMMHILESQGFRVLQATGGQEGIQMALEKQPDAVILDLMMPVVNGFDVARQLREHEATRHIPIFVFTAKDISKQDRERLQDHVQSIASKSHRQHLLQELERLTRA